MLAVAATVGTVVGTLTAAGEELGWRGYMLIPGPVPRRLGRAAHGAGNGEIRNATAG